MSAGSFTKNLHVSEKGPNTRFLVSYLNRWSQPDTIVPGYANPQNLNRYAYVLNSPLNLVDPTGHCAGPIMDDERCFTGNRETLAGPGAGARGSNGSASAEDDLLDDESEVDDWGSDQSDESRKGRAQLVWDSICESGGWWGSGCPSQEEITWWLLAREGGYNILADDTAFLLHLAGINYRFNTLGLSVDALAAYTAFFNPKSDGVWNEQDWNLLVNTPPPTPFVGAFESQGGLSAFPPSVDGELVLYTWRDTEGDGNNYYFYKATFVERIDGVETPYDYYYGTYTQCRLSGATTVCH